MYSGRYWYDQQNQKERLDIKEHIGQLTMYITRYDLVSQLHHFKIKKQGAKYIVHRNSSGYTCNYEQLDNNTLIPPVNLTHAKFIGNETWWGEMCDHYQILDLKDDAYLEYYVIQNSNIPYGFVNSRHVQTTWMFTTVGPIDQNQFELPKGVTCNGEEESRKTNKIKVNE